MRRNRVADSPERQRKVALIRDALLKRGLNGNLTAGGGEWSVYCYAVSGLEALEPLLNVTLRRGSFDDLLALVEDDLQLARFLYSQRSSEQAARHGALRHAEYQLFRAKDDYSRACVGTALGAIDKVSDEEFGKRTLARNEAHSKLVLARGVERQAREEYDAYHAAAPKNQEEARAYLASLPTVVRH